MSVFSNIFGGSTVFIHVPYGANTIAKNLGARFDKDSKMWYVSNEAYENNEELRSTFGKRLPDYIWYRVPFDQKETAKEMGCDKFNKELKAWGCIDESKIEALDDEFRRHEVNPIPPRTPSPTPPPRPTLAEPEPDREQPTPLVMKPRTYYKIDLIDWGDAREVGLRWDESKGLFFTRSDTIKGRVSARTKFKPM